MTKFTARQIAIRAKMLVPHPTQYPSRVMYYDARTTREAFESSDIFKNGIKRRHGELKARAKSRARLCQDGAWRVDF